MPSTKIKLAPLSSFYISLILSTVSSETIYWPNSSLIFLAVVPVSSPLSAAYSRIISPMLTTIADFSIAVSKKMLFPEPGIPVTPKTIIKITMPINFSFLKIHNINLIILKNIFIFLISIIVNLFETWIYKKHLMKIF